MALKNQIITVNEISPRIYCIKDYFVNIFVIKIDDQLVCIDTGIKEANIKHGFRHFNLDMDKVSHVLLTHSDFDHIANTNLFKYATIYLSKEEALLLKRRRIRSLFRVKRKSVEKYVLLDDNRTLNIGNNKIKTIYSPGHTDGSAMFLLNDCVLFTGDTLILKNGKAKPFYPIFNMDKKVLKETIRRISKLDGIKYMVTSHTGYTDNFDQAMDEWKIKNTVSSENQ